MRLKEAFQWNLHKKGASILVGLASRFCDEMPMAGELRNLLIGTTRTRITDWIDHMLVPCSWVDETQVSEAGFERKKVTVGDLDLEQYSIDGSNLFPLFVTDKDIGRLYLKVENIEDFARVHGGLDEVQGKRWGPRRKLVTATSGILSFGAVERRGYDGYLLPDPDDQEQYTETLWKFMQRKRHVDQDECFNELEEIVEDGLGTIGADRTADAFFFAERRYWESRNAAGRWQLQRQKTLGLGWGNHDHHTFRCSRENFSRTVSILERMGSGRREKFYAGEQAGWGAQVLESKACGVTVFADVDLTPDEKDEDFARDGLEEEDSLGTVGLWVGLHGESVLSAGLHHLAARVSFSIFVEASSNEGFGTMPPFSGFPYLKQCFTEPENWNVIEDRARRLLEKKQINKDQLVRFMSRGALGSHLELIERNQGYKGFNQKAVSDIIKRTDPRL